MALKAALFISSACLLSGCISTTYVSSIGAREDVAEINAPLPENAILLEFQTYSMAPVEIEGSKIHFPYIFLGRWDGEKKGWYEAEFSPSGVRWDSALEDAGIVSIRSGSMLNDFKIQYYSKYEGPGNYEVSRRYREWYGYPAQLGQIVAVPVDAVIVTGVALYMIPLKVVHAVWP